MFKFGRQRDQMNKMGLSACNAVNFFEFFFVFSADIPAAHETLQAIVYRLVNEFLQPEVNNLTPKQD